MNVFIFHSTSVCSEGVDTQYRVFLNRDDAIAYMKEQRDFDLKELSNPAVCDTEDSYYIYERDDESDYIDARVDSVHVD